MWAFYQSVGISGTLRLCFFHDTDENPLTSWRRFCIIRLVPHGGISQRQGRLAQLVEHSLDVRRVSGSSPLTSTIRTTVEGISILLECSAFNRFFMPEKPDLTPTPV